MLDPETLAEITGQIVREHVAKAVAPIAEENGRLRERIAVLEARELPAPDLTKIRDLVSEEVAALPPAKPGKDGVDFQPDMPEISRLIDEAVTRRVAEIERPKDGASVTIDDVRPLVEEAVTRAISAVPPPKDGVGLAGALIDRTGALIVTLTDGSTIPLGQVVGRDFDPALLERAVADAVAEIPIPKDGEPGADADPAVIARMVEEAVALIPVPKDGEPGKDAYAGTARGLWDATAEYRAMDVVSFNGSEWRAKRDDPGELPGDGWMLSAGRGKRGAPGDPGKPGVPGPAIIAGYTDSKNLAVILTREDGEEITIDLFDLAQVIKSA